MILPIKKQWFDMIKSGQKKEEYREVKQYYKVRFEGKEIYSIHFRNGYGNNKPTIEIEVKSIKIGFGKSEWGAVPGIKYYILELGKTIVSNNID